MIDLVDLAHTSPRFTLAQALDDALVKAPPMGYNSWNHFGCTLNQETLGKPRETAKLARLKRMTPRCFNLA